MALLFLAGGFFAGCASPGHHYWINSLEDSLTEGKTPVELAALSSSRYQHEVDRAIVTSTDAEAAFAESLSRLALGSRNTWTKVRESDSYYYLLCRSTKTEGLLYARKSTRTVRFFTSR